MGVQSKALQFFWKIWRKEFATASPLNIVTWLSEHLKKKWKIIYLLVADTLGINRSTARGIIATYVREGRIEARPRGGRNNVKVDDDMKDCLNNILDENCMLTLDQINQELRNRCPTKPHVHQRTIAKALDGIMVTVKLARPVPAERNRPDVIDRRHQYANWFMAEGVINYCVFIDECGYNIWTARSHGRARVGERAYRQGCGQRGRNVTIMMAIYMLYICIIYILYYTYST